MDRGQQDRDRSRLNLYGCNSFFRSPGGT